MAKAATISFNDKTVDELNEYLNELERRVDDAGDNIGAMRALESKIAAYDVLRILGIYASDRNSNIKFMGTYFGDFMEGIDD